MSPQTPKAVTYHEPTVMVHTPKAVQDAMMLTHCPYDPMMCSQDAMMLTHCPYDPMVCSQDAISSALCPAQLAGQSISHSEIAPPHFQNGLQAKSGFEMCFDIGS